MAKSEVVAVMEDAEEFNADEILDEDLSQLPERQVISGLWKFQWISSKCRSGISNRNGKPYSLININFDPVEPVGPDAEDQMDELDMDDLPRVPHTAFYRTVEDKRAFVELLEKCGLEQIGTLRENLEAVRGRYVIAHARQGTDSRGMSETKLSGFKRVEQ